MPCTQSTERLRFLVRQEDNDVGGREEIPAIRTMLPQGDLTVCADISTRYLARLVEEGTYLQSMGDDPRPYRHTVDFHGGSRRQGLTREVSYSTSRTLSAYHSAWLETIVKPSFGLGHS